MIPLCRETVTVYRKSLDTVTRQVVRNCCLQLSDAIQDTDLGKHARRSFLLIVPPGAYVPKIGDRVLAGIGPAPGAWDSFLPCTTEGLCEVGVVTACKVAGKLHHYEAENR